MRAPSPVVLLVLLLFGSLAVRPGTVRAESLAADISEHLIAITTAFSGTTVTLFGMTDGSGDVAVTVFGPRETQVVRQKDRVAGIWLNVDEMAFEDVPTFYAFGSSRPIDEIATTDVRARHEFGVDHLRLEPLRKRRSTAEDVARFRRALVRNKQRQDLFSRAPAVVNFIGPALFRTELQFPANVPPGLYQVQVFELQEGMVVDAQRSTLVISKVGVEADIYDFAHNRSVLYGLGSVVLAIFAGWLGSVVFKRG